MAEAEETVEASSEEAPKKKSKMGLIIGVVLALVLGGGGFYAVYSGMILGPSTSGDTASDSSGHGESTGPDTTTEEGGHAAATEHGANGTTNAGFVPLEPLVVSLKGGSSQHLRFRGELEVETGMEEEVSHLVPRVMDVLNSYLRAVSITDLEDPTTLVTLRAQMLRRIQLVVGAGKVHDLLIMEFVLS
ncbi:MAG: flagellar basal body-associated FliL family protein [Maritimibacter sp.]|jgi:flagellar protein FliL